MIYEVTMFFSEFDLLSLKISESSKSGSQLIAMDSEKTFSNKEKEASLHQRRSEFPEIIVGLIKSEEFGRSAWDNERHQRNSVMELIDLKNDDIIIATDLDEIINHTDIDNIVSSTKDSGFVHITMDMYYYYINSRVGKWGHAFACTGKYFLDRNATISELRNDLVSPSVATKGKHFAYLGGAESVSAKLGSFSHTEYDKPFFTDVSLIKERMENLEDPVGRKKDITVVEVDDSYPEDIINNRDFWKKYEYKKL